MNTRILDALSWGVVVILLIFVGWSVYSQMREHYMQYDPKLQKLKERLSSFFSRDRYWSKPLESLNSKNVMNKITLYRGKKSYTINKEKVFLCMKDDDGAYYSDNMLIYVLAHEIAHVINDEIGHTQKFHDIFGALLVELAEEGIYDPTQPVDNNYCHSGDPEL